MPSRTLTLSYSLFASPSKTPSSSMSRNNDFTKGIFITHPLTELVMSGPLISATSLKFCTWGYNSWEECRIFDFWCFYLNCFFFLIRLFNEGGRRRKHCWDLTFFNPEIFTWHHSHYTRHCFIKKKWYLCLGQVCIEFSSQERLQSSCWAHQGPSRTPFQTPASPSNILTL